jgi:CRP/FNR family transcriptional regulator, anaerobic regulatory protein
MDSPIALFLKTFKDSNLRTEIIKVSDNRNFKHGEVIFHENTHTSHLYIAMQGCLKVVKTYEENRDFLMYYIQKGEICADCTWPNNEEHLSKIKLVGEREGELLLIPIASALAWFRKYPSWAEFMIHQYHHRLENFACTLKSNATTNLEGRVLLFLCQKEKIFFDKVIKTTHQEIADSIGTSREVVTRTLKKLEQAGKIDMIRSTIKIIT